MNALKSGCLPSPVPFTLTDAFRGAAIVLVGTVGLAAAGVAMGRHELTGAGFLKAFALPGSIVLSGAVTYLKGHTRRAKAAAVVLGLLIVATGCVIANYL
jgi:hypothetical protein